MGVAVAAMERSGLLPSCRRRNVVAVLVAADGRVFVGSNGVALPLPQCPRTQAGMKGGEGWEICREVCNQRNHAERDVLARAGTAAMGGTLYLIGHERVCPDCMDAILRAGVRELVVALGRSVPLTGIADQYESRSP